DRIAILENAYYSVISPEGCAAILWRNKENAEEAAKALKLTAKDLLKLGVVDEVISEPIGGAHRNPQEMALRLSRVITRYLNELSSLSKEDLLQERYAKFRRMGQWEE
ncbi:MAG: acetyl-CoA carboxylase carboxyl transferase subunit alpha, partial [Candidatus Omnitrophota bacterium]